MTATEQKQGLTSRRWFKPALFILGTLAVVIVPILAYQPPTNTLMLDKQEYTLEIATSGEKRQKGLGGRETMPANQGMLFIEQTPRITCYWMKDMYFSIDILWLDDKKIIRHIEERVSPDTYPKSFCPETKAKYVVELTSGSVDKHELKVGLKLPLQ